MLTALNENFHLVSLAKLSTDEVAVLKNTHSFFCPECNASLIIKTGNIKIAHFAHKSGTGCEGKYEPETLLHLKGKISLQQYFSNFVSYVKLEHYLPSIKQRPDIFISVEGRSFAIEYQCSVISSSDFSARTKGYQEEGIEPLWILGKPVKSKGPASKITLSHFQQYFIRFSPHAGYWLAFYNSNNGQMYFYYHLYPLSSTQFTAEMITMPLSSVPFPFQLPIKNKDNSNGERFFFAKQSWIQNKLKYNRGVNDRFLKALYLGRDHLLNLPDYIGLPTENMMMFKSHPIEWQYYVWNDVIKKKNCGDRILVEEIGSRMHQRLRSGDILFRSLPLVEESRQTKALEEYLFVLAKRDIIKRKSNKVYLKI